MKALQYIKEWFFQTLAAFLLYIILWLPIFRSEFDRGAVELLKDFLYCGIFILTSIGVESVVLKRTGLHGLTPFRLALNGVLTLVGAGLAARVLFSEAFMARTVRRRFPVQCLHLQHSRKHSVFP